MTTAEIKEKVEKAIKTKNNLALGKMLYSEDEKTRDAAIEIMVEKLFEIER